jgi:prepilin-type processing-associated H-X9-DG protein
MHDVEIDLDDRPGSLAEMGEALGRAGVSIEGGAAFVTGGRGVAHFLFADGNAAARVLDAAGLRVKSVREVVSLKLRQAEPGQLGKLCRRMADAGVNIVVQYSDHANRLILVADDIEAATAVATEWR